MRTLVCALALASVGCVANYRHVVLPNSSKGAVVECRHKVDCYDQSTQACAGSPYSVIESEDGSPMSDFFFQGHGMEGYVIQCYAPERKE